MRDLTQLDNKESYGIKRLDVELPDECYKNKDDPINPSTDGSFVVKYKEVILCVIASSGMGWDHVSVSCENRCPTWEEMELVAKLFFEHDEIAMQLHVPIKDHINKHPFVLHWWRPRSKLKKIPLPPKEMV